MTPDNKAEVDMATKKANPMRNNNKKQIGNKDYLTPQFVSNQLNIVGGVIAGSFGDEKISCYDCAISSLEKAVEVIKSKKIASISKVYKKEGEIVSNVVPIRN